MSILEIKNLSKNEDIKSVSFNVDKGERVVIMGGNESTKNMLLRLIEGKRFIVAS